jgi:hypothetical protein
MVGRDPVARLTSQAGRTLLQNVMQLEAADDITPSIKGKSLLVVLAVSVLLQSRAKSATTSC